MNRTGNNITSLDHYIEQQYGKRGMQKREAFENGYENFRVGFLLQQARIEKGLTQEDLAVKAGTSKSYISKIENNVKEVRISTLQKIIELGLGGHLELAIRITNEKALLLSEIREAVDTVNLVKEGKAQARPAKELLNDINCNFTAKN